MSLDSNIDPDLGHEINGPGRQYFENVITDNLMDAIIELSASLWTIRDRQTDGVAGNADKLSLREIDE